jgi:polysaccharide biosynthesis transport protein
MRADGHTEQAPAVAAGEAELELRAVGQALWRKRWRILGPTLVVAALAFVAVNLLTPKYRSEARVLIETRENVFLRPEAEKAGERERAVDQEAVTSQVQLALSRDLARTVIDRVKLGERAEFDPVLAGINPLFQPLRLAGLAKDPLRMTPEERVREAYYDRLSVYQVDKSRVIAIEFQSADPELAAAAANAVAEAYLELQRMTRQDQTRAAGRWLGAEIEELRRKVAEAEARVEEFRARSSLFVGTNNTTLASQQLGELNSQLGVARGQKADAEAKARIIREILATGRSLESADFVNSELIRRLAEQRGALRAQLAEQSSTLLDGHPRIKELKAQLADTDRQIRAEARALEDISRVAGGRVEQLTNDLAELKRQAAAANTQEIELRALEREAKAQRDLLESYLAKYREASARDSLGAVPGEVRIISRAAVSSTPYFPKKLPIVLITALATLFICAGLVTTGELMSGQAYGPAAAKLAEVDRAIPVLRELRAQAGELPEIAPAAKSPAGAAPTESPPTADGETPGTPTTGGEIAELAALLRRAGHSGQHVAIVGATRGAGTTLTAIAVARVLSREARVALVDLAFRSPGLAEFAREPGTAGIADLVRGTASYGDIISRDRGSRVHIVPAGRMAEDGEAILASERLSVALDALGRTYDHVLIDAGAAADVGLGALARMGSCAVLVSGRAAAETVGAARERLGAAGFTTVTEFSGMLPDADKAAAAA